MHTVAFCFVLLWFQYFKFCFHVANLLIFVRVANCYWRVWVNCASAKHNRTERIPYTLLNQRTVLLIMKNEYRFIWILLTKFDFIISKHSDSLVDNSRLWALEIELCCAHWPQFHMFNIVFGRDIVVLTTYVWLCDISVLAMYVCLCVVIVCVSVCDNNVTRNIFLS